MLVTVLRQEVNSSEIIGSVKIDGHLFCWSLELPWRDNRVNISCIPEGHYRCEKYMSEKHGKLKWGVRNVPNRSGVILGEIGNTYRDLEGCISFGTQVGWLAHNRGILLSENAVAEFEKLAEYEKQISLEIWSTNL
jgi:hypothetical protein